MEKIYSFIFFFLLWECINFQFIFGIKRKSDQDKVPIEMNMTDLERYIVLPSNNLLESQLL